VFQTSHPVAGKEFHDRTAELSRLEQFVADLRVGSARWLAIIGPRKVGKTSLLLELSRRATDIEFVLADTQEHPDATEVFRIAALRALDQVLGAELGGSLEILVASGGNVDEALDRSATFGKFPPALKTAVRAVSRGKLDDELVRLCLDLPEKLAQALDRRIVIAIDEFQELAAVRGADPLPLVRSIWQRHRHVSYVVSGSGRSLLEEMATSKHSPFFQHFQLMHVGAFARADAIDLLVRESPAGRAIPRALAEKVVDTFGGHPFYLQLFGEELTTREPPYDEHAMKSAVQAVLFSRSGRLALYLQLAFDHAVGKSTYLAAVLDALSEGPQRQTDVATRIGASTADTARYLERLGDVVRRRDDGLYELDDPVFALWLRWRRPGGSVVPMTIIGDAAEREVAATLARLGMDLVYQSRGSRGAFDLLATRGARQLAIQVKRSPLPLVFSKTEWKRMQADAKRFGWRWTIASVSTDGVITFLDPARASSGKTIRLAEKAAIDNIVEWIDRE
jgi:AAA+ ATPase superfamily predicted ATPase/Holliday junction resolvase